MSGTPKNIDEKDAFSQLIKEKLKNHQLPIDESIWKGIEQRMAPSRKRIIPLWYWISGSVAAVLALLFILKPFSDSELSPAMTEVKHIERIMTDSTRQEITSQQPFVQATVPAAKEGIESYVENKSQSSRKISIQTLNTKKANTITAENRSNENVVAPTNVISDIRGSQTTAKSGTNQKQTAGKPATENTTLQEKKTSTTTEISSLPDLSDYPEIPAETLKARKKQPVLIAAVVGLGGTLISPVKDAPMFDSYMASPNLVKNEIATNYATVLNANDYSEAKHDPPLTVGVTLMKPLNRIFSLESGLVYTYLKSDYFRPGSTNYRGVLQLHYLGVPLNVRAKLIDQSKWDLYLSAGGMLEKGLRSIYVQEINYEQITTNTTVKSGIEGVQWSVNGALGVDYKIRKNLSLFIEPKLTYYLLNNQPRSARTEQPLTIGLNGGLRIEL